MSRIHLFSILYIFGFFINVSSAQKQLSLDTESTPEQTIPKYGYPFENHTVQTRDGYLLSLHRIPYGVKNIKYVRPPVLIMHGIVSSSADFLVLGPRKSIPFLLADAGYDVWLGNSRGNTFSRRHIRIDPDKENAKFYNFTLHEIGTLDLPAIIDYILSITRQNSLNYVGHSQGTTDVFILLSTLPEYNKKIKMVSALAPVLYCKHARSIAFKFLDIAYDLITEFLKFADHYEFFSHNSLFIRLVRTICSTPNLREVCADVMFIIAGFDSQQFDRDLLPRILANYPAGSSIKQALHFEQFRKNDRFAQYDFGNRGNLEMYRQPFPLGYNLSQITTRIMLHYSLNDNFAAAEDVVRLATKLSNASLKLVPWPKFNHGDYLYARDVVKLLYDDVLREIKSTT